MLEPEVKSRIDEIAKKAKHLWKFIKVEEKEKRIAELEEVMASQGFWDDQKKAQEVVSENSRLKGLISPIKEFTAKVDDLLAMREMLEEAGEDAELEVEIQAETESMGAEVAELEIGAFLSGPLDRNNAILSVNSGAGGTESCDWADMLYRMYTRWGERRGFTVEVDDMVQGEEAGISSVTLRIIGENAYGYAKAERGVHRLVRISPFDSNKRRHTSFCAVDVIGEVTDDIDIDIPDDEIRVDVFRASGKGGQHVNRTESAVRLTHLPSNIVVSCQNERSQLKNKATAMKVLKSRLYEKRLDEQRSAMEKFYGEKNEIGWGNQIRSYVFQPYQMVKDLRTGVDTSNVQGVMDGEIDHFIHAWLRAGCPTSRNKDIQIED